jgi:hypothetical protein
VTRSEEAGTMERRARWVGVVVLVLGAVGCAAESEDEAFACELGELTGTWRISYQETNGSCGRIADTTLVISESLVEEAEEACTYASSAISPDRCRIDQDYTCVTGDGRGSERWVGTMRHSARDTVSGSMTLQLDHAEVFCRSTYAITWTRQ